MTEMREKIARAIEDNLKSQGIRVVIDIAAQPDVRHICDGMLSLGALADAVLALIEPVMEENDRLRVALQTIADDSYEPVTVYDDVSFTEAAANIASAALSPKSEKQDG
jgi:hypothetical protein